MYAKKMTFIPGFEDKVSQPMQLSLTVEFVRPEGLKNSTIEEVLEFTMPGAPRFFLPRGLVDGYSIKKSVLFQGLLFYITFKTAEELDVDRAFQYFKEALVVKIKEFEHQLSLLEN